ncbi:MAG: ABC transporter substrate-binding protein [Acetobacteraceae bacterium]|nr:ABC transporter substrate-binding protein [Acetobacteraceae bacterium]
MPLRLPRPPSRRRARLKVILNRRYQVPQGLFFLAEDRGFWRAEGLEVAMDQGEGSAAAVTKVATGAYDAGFGDINAVVALAAMRPAEAPPGVTMLDNRSPFCIAVRADGPIRTPKDLEGRTLGGPASDGALRLFPAFTRLAGIDASKVTIVTMQSHLREHVLNRGSVDGIFGFIDTIRFSARLIGTDADQSSRFLACGTTA